MKSIQTHSLSYLYTQQTKGLLRRMFSPICGMVKELSDTRYNNGIDFNEATTKNMSESIEEYSQLYANLAERFSTVFLSYSKMLTIHGESVLPIEKLSFFNEAQYVRQGFPFDGYANQPITWIKLPSLLGYRYLWVPAQFIFVGYQIKRRYSEPWLSAAMNTGTAAHTDKFQALIDAMLDIIQVDSAMGHWYSSRTASKILLDKYTLPLEKLLIKQGKFYPGHMSFHLLVNPDLPAFTVASVYQHYQRGTSMTAVGLGSDMRLIRAMYKAYLNTPSPYVVDDQSFMLIQEKFPQDSALYASHLNNESTSSVGQQIQTIVQGFKQTNKELLFCDLSSAEASELGYYVPRVWSPDTLSLCLPGAPWVYHPRFLAYGGIHHEQPHPYLRSNIYQIR